MDVTQAQILAFALLLLGNVMHVLKKVVELRQSGVEIGITGYVRRRPYLTAFGFISSVGVFLVLGITDPATAMLTGFTADSAMDTVGRKAVT